MITSHERYKMTFEAISDHEKWLRKYEEGLQASRPVLNALTFTGLDLRARNLRLLHAIGATFSKADMTGLDLYMAMLSRSSMLSVILDNAQLNNASLNRCDLRWASMKGTRAAHANFEGADLRGANFEGAYLRCANFEGADLRGANFEGADLEAANLIGSLTAGANMAGANMDRVMR